MDRDYFIILVYCLVCEHYRAVIANHSLRQRGFAPALSDEEVITMEIWGEYFGLSQDEAIYAYFRSHYQHFFPDLKDRTLFVPQAANWWWIKARIQYRLTVLSGQRADPVQPIDTLPLPVCGYTRSQRDRCFKPQALRLLRGQGPPLLWLQTGITPLAQRHDPRLIVTPGPSP